MFGVFYNCCNFAFYKASFATGLDWRWSGEHCYSCVLGHCATSTLQNNKIEAKYAEFIFFEILQTILESTAYDCFGNLTSFCICTTKQ